jgi:hypothetical protein
MTLTSPRLPKVFLVLDGFGTFGQAGRETDPRQDDRPTVLANLLSGQYERALRIVASNTTEGWACDAPPRSPTRL